MVTKNMVVTWGPDCDFIFLQWSTHQWPMFIVGVVLCFLTTILSTAYGPIIYKQIKLKVESRIVRALGCVGEYLLKVYIMLLMMTMNGPVCLAIGLGMAVGYTIFEKTGENIRKKLFK